MMGVIQEKYTLADVICQHKTDGSIIPLKIRITDEDGEYQVYNIKSYKDVSNRTAYTMPNGTSVAPANHLWKFECKICAFNTLKQIQLFYNANENSWKVFWEYPKVCVNLQTGVRYNYSVWRFLLWQEEKVTHHRKQQCAK